MKKPLIRVGIGIGIVMAIIALVVCFVPLKEVAYTVTVDYQDIETYYEDEPYEEIETYYEDEPYEEIETYYETEPLAYEVVKSYTDTGSYKERRQIVIGGVVFQDEVVEVFFPIGCVTLQNIDSIYGTFRIQFTFFVQESLLGWVFRGEESLTLEPGERGTVTYSVEDIDINEIAWEWEYEVTLATKTVEKQRTVTNYRQVERQRTVTKYKQVEKERTVTKQHPEIRYKKVSLLDYLLLY